MNITLETNVAEILNARPDLRWTLVASGVDALANENHFPPPGRTVGEVAMRHGIDSGQLVRALNRAAASPPDEAFIESVRRRFPDFQGGCCGDHEDS